MMRPLHFNADGTFKIAQFTDLHWRNGDENDQKTRAAIELVLELERPDFAVFTGDILGAGHCKDPAHSLREAVRPLEDAKAPWAAVFGNHDDKGLGDRAELMATMTEMSYSLAEAGPDDVPGVGNYLVSVYASADRGRPAATLYFIDSQSYAPEEIGGYGWITHKQVAWYRRIAAARIPESGARGPVPALCFLHIPLPEYVDVWNQGGCVGMKGEAVCCPKINTGFFAALWDVGEVMGVFAGHDHVNDYVGTLHGIQLAYGRVTGYNTYPRNGEPRGARLIRLHEGRRCFDTWIRLDDGRKINEVANAPWSKTAAT